MQPLLKTVLPSPERRGRRRGLHRPAQLQARRDGQVSCFAAKRRHILCRSPVSAPSATSSGRRTTCAGKEHPIPPTPRRTAAAGRSPSLKIPATSGSPATTPARLTAKLADGKTATAKLFFVVRPAKPGKDAKILLQLSTNTYNAYTNWGGYSLYAYNGRHKRPGPPRVVRPAARRAVPQWELPFVRGRRRPAMRSITRVNSDLEFHPELLKNYKLVLSVGHDEYWSAPMRDNLEKYIGRRRQRRVLQRQHLLLAGPQRGQRPGADVLEAGVSAPTRCSTSGDHSTLSTLWSHHLVGRPENTLTGVGFLWGGYHRSHGQFMDDTDGGRLCLRHRTRPGRARSCRRGHGEHRDGDAQYLPQPAAGAADGRQGAVHHRQRTRGLARYLRALRAGAVRSGEPRSPLPQMGVDAAVRHRGEGGAAPRPLHHAERAARAGLSDDAAGDADAALERGRCSPLRRRAARQHRRRRRRSQAGVAAGRPVAGGQEPDFDHRLCWTQSACVRADHGARASSPASACSNRT